MKKKFQVCTRCETYRPPRAHHCRICKRCIRKLDHHWYGSVYMSPCSSFFGLKFCFYLQSVDKQLRWRTESKIFSSISGLRWHISYLFGGVSSLLMDISMRHLCSRFTGITDKNVICKFFSFKFRF